MKNSVTGTVLCIGGLDPSGGAGILLDSAAIRSVGLHCAAVATVVTVQSDIAFLGSRTVDPSDMAASVVAVLETQTVQAIKIGALGSGPMVRALSGLLEVVEAPCVLDPVIRSTSKGRLLDEEGLRELMQRLLPRVDLVTPNIPEVQLMTGVPISAQADMETAARALLRMGARRVLLKGGHLPGNESVDLFMDTSLEARWMVSPRLDIGEVRGTGCALGSFIAARLARGESPFDAAAWATAHLKKMLSQSVCLNKTGPRVLAL